VAHAECRVGDLLQQQQQVAHHIDGARTLRHAPVHFGAQGGGRGGGAAACACCAEVALRCRDLGLNAAQLLAKVGQHVSRGLRAA
jgi:hypothetical protein